MIYEEENDDYWTDLKNTIVKQTELDVVASAKVPHVKKFFKYGEYIMQYPQFVQRNKSLARVREVLTDMADNSRVKSKLLFMCLFVQELL